MKRIDKKAGKAVSLLLALFLVISQSVPVKVFADPLPTGAVIMVGDATVLAGQAFSVPVSIEDCPNFLAMGLKVLFNDTVFELEGISLHENVSPDSGYSLQADLDEGFLKIEVEGDGDFAFNNGYLLLLTFKVKEGVMPNDYPINLKVNEDDSCVNADEEELAGTFHPGTISVTEITDVAEYDGDQYSTIKEALAAAPSDPGAMVKVLRDVTIDDEDERLIIPAGADIKLDLNGKTITADYTGGHLIHIEGGGKLTLTSTAQALGSFISGSKPGYSDTEPAGLSFLLNEGTLTMSRIVVLDFWQGVVDGLIGPSATALAPYTGKGGSILKIEDCQLYTVFTALGLGGSTVGTLKNSSFVADAYPMALGHLYYGTGGGVESIEGSTILSRRYSPSDLYGSLYIDFKWTVSEIKDTVIADHENAIKVDREAGALVNLGTIELLTSTSYGEKSTRIEASSLGIQNVGKIDLIDGAKTRISGRHAMANASLPDFNLVADVKEIRDGQFISSGTGGALHIFQSEDGLTPRVRKISGGIFQAGSKYAVTNAGLLEEVTGGCFYGPELALKSAGIGIYSSVTGGYYKTGEEDLLDEGAYNAIPFSKGYGISTLPLQGGENAGYYHLGPAVSITWLVEDLGDRHDIFIVGDPVYYFDGAPEAPDGQPFKGWFDGKHIYKPGNLPVAGVDTIYQAVFGDAGSKTDPLILVGSDNVMAGDSFSIPVVIGDCPAFQSMGLRLSFDEDVFDLKEVALHPDRVADADHSLDVDLEEATLVIGKGGSGDMAFEDSPFLLLTFEAGPDAQSGDYWIELSASAGLWKNSNGDELDGTFIPGLIGLFAFNEGYEAFYAGGYYSKAQEAIEDASSGGPKAKVFILKDIEIENPDDRLIIPEGADIILNLQGRTITAAFDGQPLIHVQEGGKLTLTSPGPGRGHFIYHERPQDVDNPQGGSAFLVNEGILAMSRIEVKDFWQGVVDGLFVSSIEPKGLIGQAGGGIRHIEDCEFDTVFTALGLGGSLVGVLKNSQFVADAVPLVLGNPLIGAEGEVESLDGSSILSRYKGGHELLIFSLLLNPSWTVAEIKDTVVGAHEEAGEGGTRVGLGNRGTIGTITSSPSGKHTRIESYYIGIENVGKIGLIDGANTQIVGRLAMVNSSIPEQNLVAEVTEICDGQFFSEVDMGVPIVIMAGPEGFIPVIHKISGGSFQSNYRFAVVNVGLLEEVTGGRFYGPELALMNNVNGTYLSVTEGYYLTDGEDLLGEGAYNAIPFSEGYGISTLPLLEGENAGYYHVGPAAAVTWVVGDLDDRHDIFIVGDPVYYFDGKPDLPPGQFFLGWSDGSKIYQPEELPVATVPITYTALFGDLDPEDYEVIVVSETSDANAGETFTVDVKATSESNPTFFGATVDLVFDTSQLDYQEVSSSAPEGFSVVDQGNGELQIVGAFVKQGDAVGFAIPEDGFTIATLSFKVELDVETGPTLIKIEDGPVVDLLEAVDSQGVSKGEDLTVNLWNLKVTFKAGENVNLEETYAYVKYGVAGLYTAPGYGTPFTEPIPVAQDHYELDDPPWQPEVGENIDFTTIQGMAFEKDATFTATAKPKAFKLHYDPAYVTPVTGVGTDGAIAYLTPVTFKVETPKYGYKIKTVAYKVGENGTEVGLIAVGDLYTIPGAEITDHVWITVTDEVDDAVVEIVLIKNEIYRGLPCGYQLVEVRIPEALPDGQAFAIDGDLIFYSPLYSQMDDTHNKTGKAVYVYAVDKNLEVAGVLAILSVVSGENEVLDDPGNLTFGGKYDVNEDSRVNSTDVVLTYGLYKGFHLYKDLDDDLLPTLRMRLRADINGDRAVDTSDAQIILNYIWSP